MHLLLVASYPPPRARAREKVLVDSFSSNYKCLASSKKKLLFLILIAFLLLLVRHLFLVAWHLLLLAFLLLLVRHLFLIAMHLLLVASYPPPRARAREKVLVDSFSSNYKCLASSKKKLLFLILIAFLLLLVRHLFLVAWHLLLLAFLLLLVRHLFLIAMHLLLVASYPPPARTRARKGPSRFLF